MKNLIIILSTLAVLASFILLLIARANGMHPDFFAFFIITPIVYAFALSRAFMIDNNPVVDTSAPCYVLREEYREYVFECMEAGEQPWTFTDWFETCYWYEIGDNKTLVNADQYPYTIIAN